MDKSANAQSSHVLESTSYSLNQSDQFEESQFYDEGVFEMLDKFDAVGDGMHLRTGRYAGFDNNTGDTWIYPTNYPMRQYQFSITKAALYKNTLVVLPTGLGKTFIAAVVMYNLYRWYPTGKVIFMAPTRPLVNQQIEACYKIMGIPKEDTAEMTGKQAKGNRSALWQSKRVFYCTPQVVQSDLNSPDSNFPINQIKLLVIDEAHKAKGKYAYTEVVQAIASHNKNFRVLALSATPGRGVEDVAEVIKNLLISHIEVRWENSIDVSPYTHKKNIKTVVIPLGGRITRIRDKYIEIIDPYVRNLLDNGVLSGHTGSLTRGWLIMQQQRFREMSLIQRHPNHSNVTSDFSTCISMYHALELLVRHGVRVYLNFFDDDSNSTEEKYFVAKDAKLKAFLKDLREEVGPNPFAVNTNPLPNGTVAPPVKLDLDYGHPKFGILQKQLQVHFSEHKDSRAIVFCEFRDSVALVHRLLLQNRPLIRPKCIVGQGGTGVGLRAVSQKEQIAAMKDFRSGVCNTLIATCVAEEGIDVGEVDLIVCFDITKNPTRFVQRIGRTGRQKNGKVIMLVTEGKEHDTLKEVLASKDKTNQKIAKSADILKVLYRQSPRLVPTEFDPKCVETYIKVPDEVEPVPETSKKKGRKRKAEENVAEVDENQNNNLNTRIRKKKAKTDPPKGTQDVRTFFKKKSVDLNATEREIFDDPDPISEVMEDDPQNTSTSPTKPDNTVLKLGKSDQEIEIEKILRPVTRHRLKNNVKKMKIPDFTSVIKNTMCPKLIKRFFLETNIEYLRDKLEKHEIMKAVEGDDDDLELVDDEIIEMDKIFDGREEVLKAVTVNGMKLKRVEMEEEKEVAVKVSDDFTAKFMETFERYSQIKRTKPIIVEETQEKLKENVEDEIVSEMFNFDSQIDIPKLWEDNESKYLNNTCKTSSIVESPVQKPGKKSKFMTPQPYTDSPLMKAFNNSVKKRKNSDYGSPVTSKSKSMNSKMVFEFLGLKDVDDMFCDVEEDISRDIFEITADETKIPAKVPKIVEQTPKKSFLSRLKIFEYDSDEKVAEKSVENSAKSLQKHDKEENINKNYNVTNSSLLDYHWVDNKEGNSSKNDLKIIEQLKNLRKREKPKENDQGTTKNYSKDEIKCPWNDDKEDKSPKSNLNIIKSPVNSLKSPLNSVETLQKCQIGEEYDDDEKMAKNSVENSPQSLQIHDKVENDDKDDQEKKENITNSSLLDYHWVDNKEGNSSKNDLKMIEQLKNLRKREKPKENDQETTKNYSKDEIKYPWNDDKEDKSPKSNLNIIKSPVRSPLNLVETLQKCAIGEESTVKKPRNGFVDEKNEEPIPIFDLTVDDTPPSLERTETFPFSGSKNKKELNLDIESYVKDLFMDESDDEIIQNSQESDNKVHRRIQSWSKRRNTQHIAGKADDFDTQIDYDDPKVQDTMEKVNNLVNTSPNLFQLLEEKENKEQPWLEQPKVYQNVENAGKTSNNFGSQQLEDDEVIESSPPNSAKQRKKIRNIADDALKVLDFQNQLLEDDYGDRKMVDKNLNVQEKHQNGEKFIKKYTNFDRNLTSGESSSTNDLNFQNHIPEMEESCQKLIPNMNHKKPLSAKLVEEQEKSRKSIYFDSQPPEDVGIKEEIPSNTFKVSKTESVILNSLNSQLNGDDSSCDRNSVKKPHSLLEIYETVSKNSSNKNNVEKQPAKLKAQLNFDLENLDEFFASSNDDLFGESTASIETLTEIPAKISEISTKEPEDDVKENENLTQEYDVESTLRKLNSTDLLETSTTPTTAVKVKSPEREVSAPENQGSPSIFARKFSLSRLRSQRSFCSNINNHLSTNSSPTSSGKSPYFATCKSNVDQIDFSQLDFIKPRSVLDDSLMPIAPNNRKKKRVIESSSSGSEEEIFATCAEAVPRYNSSLRKSKKPKRRRILNKFLDMECGVSGDDSEGGEDDFLSQLVHDSLIDANNSDVEDHVDMSEKYLQSIRSPLKARGGFKIPDRKKYMDLQDIFSQPVLDEGPSVYHDDTFVVHEDDVPDEEVSDVDELEIAEAILSAKKKERKRGSNQPRKRRKIIVMEDSD